MGEIVVTTLVTLDGVMEAPGGEPGHPHTGWAFDFMGLAEKRDRLDEALGAESFLIGRVTYESFAGAWPSIEGPFGDRMNAMPKHVVSTTLRDPEWANTHVISGDVAGEVARLKERSRGTILVAGSLTLVHALMGYGLVDEYRLMTFPVVVGGGRRLFPETPDKTTLRLVGTKAFDSGVVVQAYRPLVRS